MPIQIIYTSKAIRDFDEGELAEILSVAVRNNARMNVTGLLLYTQGTFMQVLEGDATTLDNLISQVEKDTRHYDMEVVVRNSIKDREFSQWHMGYRRLGLDDIQAMPNFAPFFETGFDPAKISAQPDICLEIMKALADLADHAPSVAVKSSAATVD